jgi:hypothetical protein
MSDLINIDLSEVIGTNTLPLIGAKYVVTDKETFKFGKTQFDPVDGKYTIMILVDKTDNKGNPTPTARKLEKVRDYLMEMAKNRYEVRVDYNFIKDGDFENQVRSSKGKEPINCYENRYIVTVKRKQDYPVYFKHFNPAVMEFVSVEDKEKRTLNKLKNFYGFLAIDIQPYILDTVTNGGIYATFNLVETRFEANICKKSKEKTEVEIDEDELQYIENTYKTVIINNKLSNPVSDNNETTKVYTEADTYNDNLPF